MSENFLYLMARLAAATLRPFTLLILGKILAEENLALYSIFILIIGLGILLCGADPHRVYYDRYFKGLINVELAFCDYLTKLSLLVFLGVFFTIIFGILYDLPPSLITLAAICFLIEKSFDEILRFYLFKKDFSKWSRIILMRVILNHISIALFGFAYFWLEATPSLTFFLFVITCMSALSFGLAWNSSERASWEFFSYVKIIAHRVKRSLKCIHLILWDLIRVSSLGTVNHVDRLIIGFVDTSVLASMTLLNMCFGFVQQFVDMFFTSRIRSDLLRGDVSFYNLCFNRSLWLAVAAGICAAFFAMYASQFVAGSNFNYSIEFITFYLFFHVAISLTAILQQLVYWGGGLQLSFVIELLFLLLLGVLTGILIFTHSTIFWYLGAFAIAVGARGLIYSINASRQQRRIKI
jgi:hypothetical protein